MENKLDFQNIVVLWSVQDTGLYTCFISLLKCNSFEFRKSLHFYQFHKDIWRTLTFSFAHQIRIFFCLDSMLELYVCNRFSSLVYSQVLLFIYPNLISVYSAYEEARPPGAGVASGCEVPDRDAVYYYHKESRHRPGVFGVLCQTGLFLRTYFFLRRLQYFYLFSH